MKIKSKYIQGFTLVELMVVIAVISIMSAVAIPNYLTFRLKSKISEAKSNLGAIRIAEEAFSSEYDTYYGPIPQYPVSDPGSNKEVWNNSETKFSVIGFEPTGTVYFRYLVGQNETEKTGKGGGGGLDKPIIEAYTVNFMASAYGDLDGDGSQSCFLISNTSDVIQHTPKNIY